MQQRIEELDSNEIRYYSIQRNAYKQIPEEQFDSEKMKTIGYYFNKDGEKIYFILNVDI